MSMKGTAIYGMTVFFYSLILIALLVGKTNKTFLCTENLLKITAFVWQRRKSVSNWTHVMFKVAHSIRNRVCFRFCCHFGCEPIRYTVIIHSCKLIQRTNFDQNKSIFFFSIKKQQIQVEIYLYIIL